MDGGEKASENERKSEREREDRPRVERTKEDAGTARPKQAVRMGIRSEHGTREHYITEQT